MVQKSDANDLNASSDEVRDLALVKHLLLSLPANLAPWAEALGVSTHKTVATRLNRCFDKLLPGLISFPIPTASVVTEPVASFNFFDKKKAICEMSKFASHSPKLTYADADKNSIIPLDSVEVFDGSEDLIGAHSIEAGARLDYYSGAGNAAIYKQVRHVLNSSGSYSLPSGVAIKDLPAICRRHFKMLQRVVGIEAMQSRRSISVIDGLPQLLIPDSDAPGGYLSITPLGCGGVIAEIAKSIKAFSLEQHNTVSDKSLRKNVLRSAYLPVVANKQNLSGLIGPAKYIFFASPPIIDKNSRSAFSLANNPQIWVRIEFKNLRFSKDDPSFRFALRIITEQISEILNRSTSELNVSDSTTLNERNHEISSIRYLSRRVVSRILFLSSSHSDLVKDSIFDLSNFDVVACSLHILHGIVSMIGIAVSPHSQSVWLNAIQVEINKQLQTAGRKNICG